MNEQEIRKIVNDEIKKNLFRLPKIPPHKHDGVDNIKIPSTSVIPGPRVNSGPVTFSQKTRYTIKTGVNASSVWFYGIAYDNSGTNKAHIVGNALLGNAFYLQPLTTTSVTQGGPEQGTGIYPPAQSSSYFSSNGSGSGSTFHAGTSTNHIIDVFFGGTIYARATINGYQDSTGVHGLTPPINTIIVSVDYLSSGWNISGNFVIT